MYCVWQVVRTPTIISNNPVYAVSSSNQQLIRSLADYSNETLPASIKHKSASNRSSALYIWSDLSHGSQFYTPCSPGLEFFPVRCVGSSKLKITDVTLALCLLGKLLASLGLVCLLKWGSWRRQLTEFPNEVPHFYSLMVYDRKILQPVSCRPITLFFKCHSKRAFNNKLSCLAPYMVRRSSSWSLAHIHYINAHCLNQNCYIEYDSLLSRTT